MITYEVWDSLLYVPILHIITFWSIFSCLLFSCITIPLDVLLSPIEILALITYGIIKLIEKTKEKEND